MEIIVFTGEECTEESWKETCPNVKDGPLSGKTMGISLSFYFHIFILSLYFISSMYYFDMQEKNNMINRKTQSFVSLFFSSNN